MSEADTAAAEESPTAAAPTRARSVQGSVESARMDKTITVLVERQLQHPLYKKYIRRSTRLHAHDANNECQKGDVVIIEECRPISKIKSWRLVKVLSRTDGAAG
jgi:small subunit ribosomal protein S17